MALHTDLPIHRTGVQLLALALKAQQQMPRGVKRSLVRRARSSVSRSVLRVLRARRACRTRTTR